MSKKQLFRPQGLFLVGTLLAVFVFYKCKRVDAPNFNEKTMMNYPVYYRSIKIDGVNIFYREAGPGDAPVLLLMHGFPSSSFMFRNLINDLKRKYHVIAPDYPGFGHSSAPAVSEYKYTFENLSITMEKFIDTIGIEKFSMYIQDYGAPIGLRLVTRRPELLECLLVQNGNAYEEGLGDSWTPLKAIWSDPDNLEKKQQVLNFMQLDGTRFQYLEGVGDSSVISPDTYTIDQALLERPGSKEAQYQLFYDYRNNVRDYHLFHEMFRKNQPPTLIIWGDQDVFFTTKGALAYGKDIKNIEYNFYKTGHFALEEYGNEIGEKIDIFLQKNVRKRD